MNQDPELRKLKFKGQFKFKFKINHCRDALCFTQNQH